MARVEGEGEAVHEVSVQARWRTRLTREWSSRFRTGC